MRWLVVLLAMTLAMGASASVDDAVRVVADHLPEPPVVYGASPTLSEGDAEALREAFAAMERARVLDGNDEARLSAYAQAAEALGYTDLASRALRKLTASTPDDPARWLKLGELLAARGARHGAEAFDALKRAEGLNAEDPRVHFLLGKLYHDQGVFEAAREAYEAADALPVARVGLAVLKVYQGEMVSAEADLNALGRDAQPFDVRTRLWLREALRSWENTRQFLPDTAEAHGAYARLLYRAARLPEAVLAARRATVLKPEDADLWNFLGAMLSQLGQGDQARDAYQRSLEANPDQPALRDALKGAPRQGGQGQGPLR